MLPLRHVADEKLSERDDVVAEVVAELPETTRAGDNSG